MMNIQEWAGYIRQLHELLKKLCWTDLTRNSLDMEVAFSIWCNKAREVGNAERVIYLIGNGASASMASHFAADLAKNAGIHTEVFSDLSLITAISNDQGYENVFHEPLLRRAKEGDMLIAISSSGNSPNILKAVNTARKKAVFIVTLSAMSENNELRNLGDLNGYISAQTYGLAETSHAAVLHHWLDRMEIEKG